METRRKNFNPGGWNQGRPENCSRGGELKPEGNSKRVYREMLKRSRQRMARVGVGLGSRGLGPQIIWGNETSLVSRAQVGSTPGPGEARQEVCTWPLTSGKRDQFQMVYAAPDAPAAWRPASP